MRVLFAEMLSDLVVEYPWDGEGDAGDPDDGDDPDRATHLGLARDAQRVADGLQGRDSIRFQMSLNNQESDHESHISLI